MGLERLSSPVGYPICTTRGLSSGLSTSLEGFMAIRSYCLDSEGFEMFGLDRMDGTPRTCLVLNLNEGLEIMLTVYLILQLIHIQLLSKLGTNI